MSDSMMLWVPDENRVPSDSEYEADTSDNESGYDSEQDSYPSTIPDSQDLHAAINLEDHNTQLSEYQSQDTYAGCHVIQFRALSPLWNSDLFDNLEYTERDVHQPASQIPVIPELHELEHQNQVGLEGEEGGEAQIQCSPPATPVSAAFDGGDINAIFIGFDPILLEGSRRRPRINRSETYFGKPHSAGNDTVGIMMWFGRNYQSADKMAGWLREGKENDKIQEIIAGYGVNNVSIVINCLWFRRFEWNGYSCWEGECSWKVYHRTSELYGVATDMSTGDEYSEAESEFTD